MKHLVDAIRVCVRSPPRLRTKTAFNRKRVVERCGLRAYISNTEADGHRMLFYTCMVAIGVLFFEST